MDPGQDSPGSSTAGSRSVNVQEAKTHLSALLARSAAGERIVVARHGKPSPRRQLGFLEGAQDDALFEPLPDPELECWGS